jgi:hypothetical protein
MRTLLLLLTVAASAQLTLAVFNYAKYNEHDSIHREPTVKTPLVSPADVIQEGWVRQRLDNFDPQNTQHFYMRYLMNSEHLREGGPLFIVSTEAHHTNDPH